MTAAQADHEMPKIRRKFEPPRAFEELPFTLNCFVESTQRGHWIEGIACSVVRFGSKLRSHIYPKFERATVACVLG